MTRRVRGALRRALMNNPSGCGTVAEEDALKELDAAISAALSLAPDSAQDLAVDAQRLLESASILRKVRILSSNQHYQQIIDFIAELQRTLVPEVLDEIATRVREARDYICFHQLQRCSIYTSKCAELAGLLSQKFVHEFPLRMVSL